jgi:hypothetical protein
LGQRPCQKEYSHHQRRCPKIPHARKTDRLMGYVRQIFHKRT